MVAKVGPAKILAKKGGGTDPLAAAGVVCSGIEVDPPRGSILTISFKHPDAGIVQPVLSAVIHSYMLKHLEVRGGGGEMEDYLTKQKDELRKKLGQTEMELKRLKTEAKVLFLEDAKHAFQSQIAKAAGRTAGRAAGTGRAQGGAGQFRDRIGDPGRHQ